MSDTADRANVTIEFKIKCPCGAWAYVGREDDDTPVLAHDIPQCTDWEERDPLEYLRWVRLSLPGIA